MKQITLNVRGMTCDHCQSSVTGALKELDGVTDIEVRLDKGTADIKYDESKVSDDQMKNAVEEQGYDVG